MPFIVENPDSRSYQHRPGGGSTGALIYTVYETDDLAVVDQLIQATLPAFFPGRANPLLVAQGYSVDATENTDVWTVTADYAERQPTEPPLDSDIQPGETAPGGHSTFESRLSISFNTSGGTLHITKALDTISFPSTAPDFNDAINVSGPAGELVVEGLDIEEPGFEWVENHRIPAEAITEDYLDVLKRLTKTTNASTFRGHDPGEVLFRGASGKHVQGEQFAEISYTFRAVPNVELDPDDLIPGSSGEGSVIKNGHVYLWFRYVDSTDNNSNVKKPTAGYLSQVYEVKEWDELGIGN